MRVPSLGWEDPLEEGLGTHSSILVWKLLWTEESGGLHSIGSQKVGHWSDSACMHKFSCSVTSDSLRPHGAQIIRLPCPSPTRGACSDSCPVSQWCHPTISSSAIPFSSCVQSFPASGSFPMSQFFASGGLYFRPSVALNMCQYNDRNFISKDSEHFTGLTFF